MVESRAIPGFSSDSIRLDQAKSTKRAAASFGQARMNKLKLVQDARANWRKDRAVKNEAKRVKLEADTDAASHPQGEGHGDISMESADERGPMAINPEPNGVVLPTTSVPAPQALAPDASQASVLDSTAPRAVNGIATAPLGLVA